MCSLVLRTQPSEGFLQAFLVTLIFSFTFKYKCACWCMLENRLDNRQFIIIFLSVCKLLSYIFCICVNYSNCILQNNQIKCMTHLLYFVAVKTCFQSGVTVQCFQITATAWIEFLCGQRRELWVARSRIIAWQIFGLPPSSVYICHSLRLRLLLLNYVSKRRQSEIRESLQEF